MKNENGDIMKGYKGFDKDMKCSDMQFEVGKTYEHDGDVKLCKSRFHFCENPLDIFNYYPPSGSKFAEIEAEEVSTEKESDSKRCSKKLTVKALVDFSVMIKASVEFVFKTIKASKETQATTGNYANSATTGDYAHSATTGEDAHSATTGCRANSATTGNYAHSATTGDRANSAVEGKNSIAAGIGINNSAKGALGCWIVLAEWEYDNEWKIKSVKSALVDGKKIKVDTFYTLKNGKFVKE